MPSDGGASKTITTQNVELLFTFLQDLKCFPQIHSIKHSIKPVYSKISMLISVLKHVDVQLKVGLNPFTKGLQGAVCPSHVWR